MTLICQNRQAWVPWVTGSLVVFNVALNFIVIPLLSLQAAAIATTATERARAIVVVTLARRVVGSVSLPRVTLSPVLGCLGMAGVCALLGTGLAVLPLAAAVYFATLVALERRLYPHDLRIVLDAVIRRRSPVT